MLLYAFAAISLCYLAVGFVVLLETSREPRIRHLVLAILWPLTLGYYAAGGLFHGACELVAIFRRGW